MNLEKFLQLQGERISDSDAGLQNSAKGERYLQQSYEGRYLFELIQNDRDANKLANIKGHIIIEVYEDKLLIANTCQPFDEKGIEGITLIENSTKGTQRFIGFKGIGFKSVVEISDNPRVITKGKGNNDKHFFISYPDYHFALEKKRITKLSKFSIL
jgi:hypothetical protein